MVKRLILLKIQNMLNINVDLLQWFIIFLDKKTAGGAVTRALSKTLWSKTLATRTTQDKYAIENKELVQELHKTITKK